MVLAVSLVAAAVFFVSFWLAVLVPSNRRRRRWHRAAVAVLASTLAWTAAVIGARVVGMVKTEESIFHHLYVLGVVGLPVIGVVLAAVTMFRSGQERSDRLPSMAVAIAFMIPAAFGVWATHIEPNRLETRHATVEIAGSGESIVIGVIADIQTDRFGEFEDRAIDEVVAAQPDLIVVAGDMTQVPFDEYVEIADESAAALARLEAPYGVYMIQGNTDPGPLLVAQMADAAGIVPLLDEIVEIEVRGQRVRLGGISWPNNRRSGAIEIAQRFVEGAGPDTIDVFLSHSPDGIFNLPVDAPVDVIISGHTHGGQISVPFWGPLWNVTELPDEVAAGGLHEQRGMNLYVSTGVGVQRGESPKVRFGVPPTVDFITIRGERG